MNDNRNKIIKIKIIKIIFMLFYSNANMIRYWCSITVTKIKILDFVTKIY